MRRALVPFSLLGVLALAPWAKSDTAPTRPALFGGGDEVDAEIARREEDLARCLARIEEIDERLGHMDADVESAHAESERLRGELRRRVRVLYKIGRGGILRLFLSARTADEMLSRARLLRWMTDRDAGAFLRAKEREDSLGEERQRLERERSDLARLRVDIDARHAELLQEKQVQRAFGATFTAPGGSIRVHPEEFAPADAGGPFPGARRFEAGTRAGGGGFALARGRLAFPVAGSADIRRVERGDNGGQGIEFRSAIGSAVRAVHPGRVEFADVYRGYGRLVIVSHGDRYYTLFGNLGAIDVQAGDAVETGQVLGRVGDAGGGPVLYFEIRRGSAAVDPLPYFGL